MDPINWPYYRTAWLMKAYKEAFVYCSRIKSKLKKNTHTHALHSKQLKAANSYSERERERESTKNWSTASNSIQSMNAAWAFSTVFVLPVRHFATIASHTSLAYLQHYQIPIQITKFHQQTNQNERKIKKQTDLAASESAARKNAIKASSAFSCTGALESATVFLKSGPKVQIEH